MKIIDIYSFPRSGTNLLAFTLSKYYGVHSVNTGGGRYPFRTHKMFSSSIFENPKVLKSENCKYIVKDELHFRLVGSRLTHFSQLFYKYISYKNQKILIIRNPYSIIRSMHDYQCKNGTHNYWDMNNKENLDSFFSEFKKFAEKLYSDRYINLNITNFFTNNNYQEKIVLNLFSSLKLSEQTFECELGHKLTSPNYSCSCGNLEGQGNFNPNLPFDKERFNRPLLGKITKKNYEYCQNMFQIISDKYGIPNFKDGENVDL